MTPRRYGAGRTARAPDARLSPDELARLKAVEERAGVSHADWIMKHVKGDEEMKYSAFGIETYKGYEIAVNGVIGSNNYSATIFSKSPDSKPIYNSGSQPSKDQAIGKAQEYIDHNLTTR